MDKPVACVALVRRALQKAGHGQAAKEFTQLAFGTANEDFLTLARSWVSVGSSVPNSERQSPS